MANYGELITTLSADWRNYEKDLNKALKLLEEFHGKTQRLATTSLQARQRATTTAGGGSSGLLIDMGSAKNTEAFERNLRRQREIAEAELRRLGAIQERATKENLKLAENAERQKTKLAQEAERQRQQLARQQLQLQNALEKQQLAARKEILRSQIANDKEADRAAIVSEKARVAAEKEALQAKVAGSKAANAKVQALAAEELRTAQLNAKARADAEKEFQQFVGSSLKQGGQGALTQAREMDRARTEELKKSGTAAAALNQHLAKMKESLGDIAKRAGDFAKFMGVGFVVGGVGSFVGEAIKLNRELQLQRLTLAANLALTTKIVDANGTYVGKQRELNLNLAAAGKLIQQIRKEAQSTTLTEQELRPVVGRTLGLAMRQGASQEGATHLISQLANIARIAGVQGEQQLGANIRGVLTGRMVGRLPLGQLLGLDEKQVKNAREAGTLIELLTKKMAAADGIVRQASASFDHLWSTLISKAKDFIQLSTERVFERLTGHILDLNKAFSDEKIAQYADIFSKKLVAGYEALDRFVNGNGFKSFVHFFEYVVEHAGQLLTIFGSLKALQALSGGGGGLTGALGGLIGKIPGVGLLAGVAAGGVAAYQIGGMLGEQAGRGVTPDLVRRRNVSQQQLQAAMQNTTEHRSRFSQASIAFFGERSDENRLILHAEQRQFEAAKANEERLRKEYYATGQIKAKANAEALHRISRDNDEESQQEKEDAEKQRLDVAKQIADYTNNKIQARRVEFEQAKASALKDVDDEKLRGKLIAVAYKAMVRDIHQIREDGRLEEREARAKTAGNEIEQIRVQGQKEFVERSRTIRDRLQNEAQANKQIAQLRVQIAAETSRKVAEKEREFYTKATDLAKQYHDLLRKQGEERRSLNKELHDAETRHTNEMARMLRERFDAQENLNRAEQREPLNQEGVDIRLQREALRGRARETLERPDELTGLTPLTQIRNRFFGPESMGRFGSNQEATTAFNAEVERTIDQMVASPRFARENQGLSDRELLLQRRSEQQQLAEERADVGKPVQAARARLTDAGDQIRELQASYQENIKSLRERFNKAVDDSAAGLSQLAVEIKKFLAAIGLNHIPLTPQQRSTLQSATGASPSQIRESAARQINGGPVTNVTINVTSNNPDHILKVITTELEKQSRRTAFR